MSFGEETPFPSCTYKRNGPTINQYNNSFPHFILSSLLLYNTLSHTLDSLLSARSDGEELADFCNKKANTRENSALGELAGITRRKGVRCIDSYNSLKTMMASSPSNDTTTAALGGSGHPTTRGGTRRGVLQRRCSTRRRPSAAAQGAAPPDDGARQ